MIIQDQMKHFMMIYQNRKHNPTIYENSWRMIIPDTHFSIIVTGGIHQCHRCQDLFRCVSRFSTFREAFWGFIPLQDVKLLSPISE